MTTTTIATTTALATAATPVVKITRTTLVNALYGEARGLILGDVPTARVPRITTTGVEAVQALVTTRDPLTEWLILAFTMSCKVRKFPAPTRRRRVLTGLVKWLRGVPGWVQEEEGWFCPGAIQAVAEATRHTATPAEAAGVYALEMLRRAC